MTADISIHALREEGDLRSDPKGTRNFLFLSTPSVRRATCQNSHLLIFSLISIHALREEGDGGAAAANGKDGISIHALREEGDMQTRRECYVCRIFLSTPSVRRATCTPAVTRPEVRIISIHALREEGDPVRFLPISRYKEFLSTPSARRATWQRHDHRNH